MILLSGELVPELVRGAIRHDRRPARPSWCARAVRISAAQLSRASTGAAATVVGGRTALEGENHAGRVHAADRTSRRVGPGERAARAVTTSIRARCAPRRDPGPRTLSVIPRFSTVSGKKVDRRSRGSSKRHLQVGSEHGQGDARDAGAAADVDDRAASGIRSASAAPFSTCRSQSRSTSRGPMSARRCRSSNMSTYR